MKCNVYNNINRNLENIIKSSVNLINIKEFDDFFNNISYDCYGDNSLKIVLEDIVQAIELAIKNTVFSFLISDFQICIDNKSSNFENTRLTEINWNLNFDINQNDNTATQIKKQIETQIENLIENNLMIYNKNNCYLLAGKLMVYSIVKWRNISIVKWRDISIVKWRDISIVKWRDILLKMQEPPFILEKTLAFNSIYEKILEINYNEKKQQNNILLKAKTRTKVIVNQKVYPIGLVFYHKNLPLFDVETFQENKKNFKRYCMSDFQQNKLSLNYISFRNSSEIDVHYQKKKRKVSNIYSKYV